MLKVSLWQGKHSVANKGSGWYPISGAGAGIGALGACRQVDKSTISVKSVGTETISAFTDAVGKVYTSTKPVYQCIRPQENLSVPEGTVIVDRPIPLKEDEKRPTVIKPVINILGPGGVNPYQKKKETGPGGEIMQPVKKSGIDSLLQPIAAKIGISVKTLEYGLAGFLVLRLLK